MVAYSYKSVQAALPPLGGAGREVYHSDHLGSTGAVTDINAEVSQLVSYAPFGEVVSEYIRGHNYDYVTDYLFNAKELDEESGMYYYSARYYTPPMFISRDPLEDKYPWISPYAYCANNPVRYTDPTGKFPIETIWDIGNVLYDFGAAVVNHIRGRPPGCKIQLGRFRFGCSGCISALCPGRSNKSVKGCGQSNGCCKNRR